MEKIVLDKNDPKSWGPKLRELRKLHNVDQEELGEELQVAKTYVSRYENGNLYPSSPVLARYAVRFDVSFSIE